MHLNTSSGGYYSATRKIPKAVVYEFIRLGSRMVHSYCSAQAKLSTTKNGRRADGWTEDTIIQHTFNSRDTQDKDGVPRGTHQRQMYGGSIAVQHLSTSRSLQLQRRRVEIQGHLQVRSLYSGIPLHSKLTVQQKTHLGHIQRNTKMRNRKPRGPTQITPPSQYILRTCA